MLHLHSADVKPSHYYGEKKKVRSAEAWGIFLYFAKYIILYINFALQNLVTYDSLF